MSHRPVQAQDRTLWLARPRCFTVSCKQQIILGYRSPSAFSLALSFSSASSCVRSWSRSASEATVAMRSEPPVTGARICHRCRERQTALDPVDGVCRRVAGLAAIQGLDGHLYKRVWLPLKPGFVHRRVANPSRRNAIDNRARRDDQRRQRQILEMSNPSGLVTEGPKHGK